MARPRQVEDLHAAWYDLLWASGDGAAETLERYSRLRDALCRQFNCSPPELQLALREDFHKWCREQGLPKPPSGPKPDHGSKGQF